MNEPETILMYLVSRQRKFSL